MRSRLNKGSTGRAWGYLEGSLKFSMDFGEFSCDGGTNKLLGASSLLLYCRKDALPALQRVSQ